MLDGTKLTVEAALQALNDGFKISTGEITTDFTKNETLTVLKKYGRLVVLQVALTGVTKAAYTNALCTLPAEYRPVKNIAVCGVLGRNNIARCTILTSGAIQSAIDLTNQEVYITACWLI